MCSTPSPAVLCAVYVFSLRDWDQGKWKETQGQSSTRTVFPLQKRALLARKTKQPHGLSPSSVLRGSKIRFDFGGLSSGFFFKKADGVYICKKVSRPLAFCKKEKDRAKTSHLSWQPSGEDHPWQRQSHFSLSFFRSIPLFNLIIPPGCLGFGFGSVQLSAGCPLPFCIGSSFPFCGTRHWQAAKANAKTSRPRYYWYGPMPILRCRPAAGTNRHTLRTRVLHTHVLARTLSQPRANVSTRHSSTKTRRIRRRRRNDKKEPLYYCVEVAEQGHTASRLLAVYYWRREALLFHILSFFLL